MSPGHTAKKCLILTARKRHLCFLISTFAPTGVCYFCSVSRWVPKWVWFIWEPHFILICLVRNFTARGKLQDLEANLGKSFCTQEDKLSLWMGNTRNIHTTTLAATTNIPVTPWISKTFTPHCRLKKSESHTFLCCLGNSGLLYLMYFIIFCVRK